jgi:hypothetical protein
MKIEIKIRHLILWLFLLYFLPSPFYFAIVYPKTISGDGGIIYILPLFVSFVSTILTLFFLFITNKVLHKKVYVIPVFFFVILFSSGISLLLFQNDNSTIMKSFLISNAISLFITGLFSYYQKDIYRALKGE